MPFAAPGAAEWLADWNAGLPVGFPSDAGEASGKTYAEQAEGAAEVLRAVLAADPDPATWVVKTLWRNSTNDIRRDLRQIFRQWPESMIAWSVDVGMTLYAEGPAAWRAEEFVQVQKAV